MKRRTRTYAVTVDLPPGMTARDMAAYIREAVDILRYSGDPEDDLFDHELRLRVKTLPAEQPAR